MKRSWGQSGLASGILRLQQRELRPLNGLIASQLPIAGPLVLPKQEERPTEPIRVLFLIDSIWGAGGAEVSLLRLVQLLPPQRYQCRVVTFHSDELADSFITRFPCPVEVWPMTSLTHPSTLGLINRLRRLVRQERFDIVHTFFPACDLLFGPLAKLCGARVLISSRRDMGIVRQPWHRHAYRLMRGRYDQVQTVSESVRRYAIDADGLDPERVLTIHNGVDPAMPVASLRVIGAPMVTIVANVRWVKGIDVFLRVAALVRERMPETKFQIAGVFGTNAEHVAYKEEVLALQKTLGLEGHVRFLGASSEIPRLLASTDVFVLTSRSEGFSNALLEAMVCGVPPVVSAVGGNPEVIEDGISGFLVPPDDAPAAAGRIVRLLAEPGLRRRMGAAARQRVLDHFTVEVMVNGVAAAYDALLNK